MIERYVALVAANAVSPAALTHYAPPQSGLSPASSPEGEAFSRGKAFYSCVVTSLTVPAISLKTL